VVAAARLRSAEPPPIHWRKAADCNLRPEIAEAEKVDRAYVSRLLNLALPAPDIQEAILEGRQAKGIQLEELTQAMPRE
jgi:hypothetical protein